MTTVSTNGKSNLGKRIGWLDTLRGIGIILVVFGHIYKNDFVIKWVYSFHLPIFFFAAGYVYKKKPILEDVKRRTKTILVPYFLFGALNLIYWVMIERRFRETDMTPLMAVIGLFKGQIEALNFNVHLWFLPCFFIMVVLYNLLVNVVGGKWTYFITLIISVVYGVIGYSFPGLPWGINRVCQYIFFYAVGVLVGEKRFVPDRIKPVWGLVGIIVVGVGAITTYYLGHGEYGKDGFAWFLNGSLGVLGACILALTFDNKLLRCLGQSTIISLCFHGPIYRILIKLFSIITKESIDSVRKNIWISLFTVALTLFVCTSVYQLICTYTPWMIGKKKRIGYKGMNFKQT